MRFITKFGASAALSMAAALSYAQEPVKIGFIGTLSTPAGYIGEDQRDAFALAIKEGGGKLGGVPVTLVVEDDGLKPGSAKQSADRMLQDGIRLFTGVNFSNVVLAVAPTVLKEDAFFVSLNAGPSNFAGEACDPNFFSVAQQTNTASDAAAIAANQMGAKKMVLIAPAYQAGRDILTGFKEAYEGEVLAEIYTKLDQSDFSVELVRIRSLQPDAIFQFLPGGAGINFAKQFDNSGLKKDVKVISTVHSMDDRMLAATGDAGEGFFLSTQWSADQDNAVSKNFVAAFEKEYNRRPTVYGATAYDTARLIGSALKAVDGDVEGKPDEFRAALRKADFDSVRGKFKFGPNQYPVQNWYLLQVARNAEGKLDYKPVGLISEDQTDTYGHLCKMEK